MAFRIELLFSGPASDNELDRAKIVGDKDVGQAIESLVSVLKNVGFDCTPTVRSVNSIPSRRKGRSRATPAEPVGYNQAAE